MFDLAAFDAEIARANRRGRPADDVLLSRALRATYRETGITRLGGTSTALVAALLLAAVSGPALFGGTPTGGATVIAAPAQLHTMHAGWLPGEARTTPQDPNHDRS